MSALPLSDKHPSPGLNVRTSKDGLFRIFAVAALTYASLYGFYRFFPHSPFSMARLPAYHTLPSGDKIPTVGLGMHTPAHLPWQPFDLDD